MHQISNLLKVPSARGEKSYEDALEFNSKKYFIDDEENKLKNKYYQTEIINSLFEAVNSDNVQAVKSISDLIDEKSNRLNIEFIVYTNLNQAIDSDCILQNRSTQLCNIIIHSCVMKKAIV